jgi:hypothetical protein
MNVKVHYYTSPHWKICNWHTFEQIFGTASERNGLLYDRARILTPAVHNHERARDR